MILLLFYGQIKDWGMLTSVCGGSNRVHFEGSGSLKGHLCIFGSLSRAQGPFSEQQLPGWLGWAVRVHHLQWACQQQRKEAPPFFAILQASKWAERRSEYLAGEARGGGGDKGVSRPFWQENFILSTLSRGLDVNKPLSQLSAGGFGQV